jgi:hypothetical protein
MNLKNAFTIFFLCLLALAAQADQMVVIRTHAFGME